MSLRSSPIATTLAPIVGFAALGVWMAQKYTDIDLGLAYFVSINLVTYPVWYIDKRQAKKGGFRIPEWTLHALSIAGGGLAAIVAMRRIRHKTRKRVFSVVHPMLAIIGICALAWWLLR